jgi:hypothetical protein
VDVEGGLELDALMCSVVSTASVVPLVDGVLVLVEGDPARDVEMWAGARRGW